MSHPADPRDSDQYGLFLPGFGPSWPSHLRFPFNRGAYRVGDVVLEDLNLARDPLIITGYSALERLIAFLAERHRARQNEPSAWDRIRLLLGTEPMPTQRSTFSGPAERLPDLIRDHWLQQGISIYRCAEVIRAIELLERGGVEVRRSGDGLVHAKVYVSDRAVVIGSSNFSRAGLSQQHEGNVRLTQGESPWFGEARQLAEAIWVTGQDYRQGLIDLLRELLSVVTWEEALARACGELLEGLSARHQATVTIGEPPLWPSQEQGIAQALWVLRNAGSALIADATGSGKTRMGARLLKAVSTQRHRTGRGGRDFAVLVCPPKVRLTWEREATLCGIALNPISQGVVGSRNVEAHGTSQEAIRRADVLAVDEAHNYLNRVTARTQALYANRADHVVLFTATPINRGTRDLLAIVDMLGADNFDEPVLDLVKVLWKRTRSAVPEESAMLRKAIQQFTVRRTKSSLNRLIAEEPQRYVDAQGRRCQYPEHHALDYPGGESAADREIAREIHAAARELRGLVRLRKIRISAHLRKRLSDAEYRDGRLASARALAAYQVRETLRSSRVALMEHLLGTREAERQAELAPGAKRKPTGNVLGRLSEIAGETVDSDVTDLPLWLTDADAHREACHQESEIYRRIAELAGRLSSAREDRKVDVMLRLLRHNRLVIAFDRHPLTLRYFEQRLHGKAAVIVATGGDRAQAARLNAVFHRESEATGVIALCSDAMSEGIGLQGASALVLLDLPSVIRLIEQRIGRIDRMDSPHPRVEVLWPNDGPEFALSSDELLVQRHNDVESLLGANILLPDDLRPGHTFRAQEVRSLVQRVQEARERQTALLGDAFTPVRALIEGETPLVPRPVYARIRTSRARVLASVSVVLSDHEWGFFAVSGTDRRTPRWTFIEEGMTTPETDLEVIAERMRERLQPGQPSLKPDEAAAERLRRDLKHVARHERTLLSRKRQHAIEEMELILQRYLRLCMRSGPVPDPERYAVVRAILDRLRTPDDPGEETTLDWGQAAEWWLEVIRPAWHLYLADRARTRPARLRDLRRTLTQTPLATDLLRTALAEDWTMPALGRRLAAAIIGVRPRAMPDQERFLPPVLA